MRHVLLTAAFGALLLLPTGCKKDESNPSSSDQFSDKLTLGTGMSGFTILGETTTFTRSIGSVMIYWRLESAADMAGSMVRLRFERQTQGAYVPHDSLTFSNPQSYGHIMLSSFNWSSAGTFRATGILVASGKSVASKEFSVN